MSHSETSTYARAKVKLTDDQQNVVTKYLSRTTKLWNYLHRHLKDDLAAYVAAPPSPEADQAFCSAVHRWQMVLLADSVDKEAVYPEWLPFIDAIRELGTGLIVNRSIDYLLACSRAKGDLAKPELKQPSGLPQFKNGNSSLSVRFNPDQFTIDKGIVKVNSVFPFQFQVADFFTANGEEMDLTITRRRRSAQAKKTYGPDYYESDETYVITLRKPEC